MNCCGWITIFLYVICCSYTLYLAIFVHHTDCKAPTYLFLILAPFAQTLFILWAMIEDFTSLSQEALKRCDHIMIALLGPATLTISVLGLFWSFSNFSQTPRCNDYPGLVTGLWIFILVGTSFVVWHDACRELSIWWRAYRLRRQRIMLNERLARFIPHEEFGRIDDLLMEDEEEARERELFRVEWHREMQRMAEIRPRRDNHIEKKIININKRKYQKDSLGGKPCVICYVDFEAGEQVVALQNCQHTFHFQCLDAWLKKSLTCPICRGGVVKPSKGDLESGLALGM